MKHVLLLLSIVFSCLFSTVSSAQTTKSVSKSDALSIAQRQFVGKDVDYYILSNSSSAVWNIFVDAEPMKGWQHDCYVLTIPKSTTSDINTIIPRKVSRRMPPQEDYDPLLVKNRYGSNANSKPQVKKAASSNSNNEAAQRTYAIVLSGGVNKNSNYERYWNDCSFIYQTLVNKYSIPKENIYPIMSDGNNPAADMRSISGGYKTQPLDLDNDGVDEIKLAATKANVKDILNRPNYSYSINAFKTTENDQDFVSMDITSKAGNLADALGDNIYNIDSLVIRGTMDDTDIHTLWEASFKGRLSVINLTNAEIENGIIPEDAFWHQKEQLDPSCEFINTIHLRKIILPDGVKRIEEGAFSYCINLEEVNIPSSLQYLGTYAFSDCVSLKTNPLVFPEGFERIGQLVFSNCRNLTGKIVLPSTIKEIDDGAFFQSKISSINLPEGLEKIGDATFYACRLKEVWIPNSCQTISGTNNFQMNYPLVKIHLPEGLEKIPNCFANICLDLQEVNIPSTVKCIGHTAFEQCKSLKKIDLPNGLETIEREAFYHCDSLEQIIFPATLKLLGQESCSYIL